MVSVPGISSTAGTWSKTSSGLVYLGIIRLPFTQVFHILHFFAAFFRVFFRVEFVNFESLRGMQLLLAKPTFFCENMMFSEEPDSILSVDVPFSECKSMSDCFSEYEKA